MSRADVAAGKKALRNLWHKHQFCSGRYMAFISSSLSLWLEIANTECLHDWSPALFNLNFDRQIQYLEFVVLRSQEKNKETDLQVSSDVSDLANRGETNLKYSSIPICHWFGTCRVKVFCVVRDRSQDGRREYYKWNKWSPWEGWTGCGFTSPRWPVGTGASIIEKFIQIHETPTTPSTSMSTCISIPTDLQPLINIHALSVWIPEHFHIYILELTQYWDSSSAWTETVCCLLWLWRLVIFSLPRSPRRFGFSSSLHVLMVWIKDNCRK